MTHRLSLTELVAAILTAGLAAAGSAALLSAQLGRFSLPAGLVAGLLGAAVVAALLLRDTERPSAGLSDLAVLALVAVGLWRVWPAVVPWPVFLDPSWYTNTAARIADVGGLRFPVAALELPEAARDTFVTTFRDERELGLPFPDDVSRGFHAVAFAVPELGKAEAVPYHPPFYAAWLALGARHSGSRGMAVSVTLWAIAWLLAAAALARASFGQVAAPVAVGLLALGPALVYYGAGPFAEPAAGTLALMGTWYLTRLVGQPPRPGWALAAGLALGAAVLVKVDAVLPLLAGLAWWAAARRGAGGRREGTGLLLGLAVPGAWFAWLALTVSALYVGLNGGGVLRLVVERWPVWLGLGLGALLLAGVFAWARQPAARRAGGSRALPGPVARWTSDPFRSAVAVVSLAVVLFVAGSLVWRALAAPDQPPGMVAILTWLITPLGMFAAVAGLLLALGAAQARTGPVVALALLAAGVVLVTPVVTQSLSALYSGRRLVPVALPVAAILAGGAVAAWWDWRGQGVAAGRSRRGWDLLVAGALVLCAVALVAAGEPLRGWREFGGGETLVRRVVRHAGERDVFVFPATLQGADPGRMAAAIWALTGRPAVVVGAPGRDPAAVAAAVDAWRADGREVFYVTDDSHALEVPIPGYNAEEVAEEAIVTTALAPRPVLPPETQRLDLQLRLFQLLPEADSR
jgi:4-amino-4-deoxy-L-arabinose transferase-like glycosyltransferase